MPELRRVLEGAGFGDVATYVMSGNAVLSSDADAPEVGRRCEAAIAAGLGLQVEVVVRDRDELAAVVARDPFAGLATNPKRYLVVFFRDAVPPGLEARLEAAASPEERYALAGREAYLWLPESVQRSRIWGTALTAGRGATARNWNTVQVLLGMLG